MQTRFELKEQFMLDEERFHSMRSIALKQLRHAEADKYTQALVLCSANGNEYSTTLKNALSEEHADEKELLEHLKAAEDTQIRYVLCMWRDTCLDIPSHTLRNMLLDLNPQNAETLIFVMTDRGASTIRLSVTVK